MHLLWWACVMLCSSADLLWMVATFLMCLTMHCLATSSNLTTRGCRKFGSSGLKRCFVLLCAYACALAVLEVLLAYLFVIPLLLPLSGTMLVIDRCLSESPTDPGRAGSQVGRAQRRADIKEIRRESKRQSKYYKNPSFWEKCLWRVFSFPPAVFRCAFLMCYLLIGIVACSLAYTAVRITVLALAYLLAALIMGLWAIVFRVLLVCAFVKQHDEFEDGGVKSYCAWSDRLEAPRLAAVRRGWMLGCGRRRNRLLGGSPKAKETSTLVQVRCDSKQNAAGVQHYYWRVSWLHERVTVSVQEVRGNNAVAKAIAYKLKDMIDERGPRRTQRDDVEAHRDELIAAAVSGQQEADAPVVPNAAAAGHEVRAASRADYQQERATAGIRGHAASGQQRGKSILQLLQGHRGEEASGQQKGNKSTHQRAEEASGQHERAASSNQADKKMIDKETTGSATESTIPSQGHAGAELLKEQGTSEISSLSLPGLNIQWPFSQLILVGRFEL